MKTMPRPLKAISFGFLALLMCSLVFAHLVSLADQHQVKNFIGITASGHAIFLGSLIIGGLALVIYGIPAFILLSEYGKSEWRFVLLSSLIPSVAASIFHWKIGVLLALFAIPIAITMRLFTGASPN